MRRQLWTGMLVAVALLSPVVRAENTADELKRAFEHITLDQPGTMPFHLKAVVAPSFARDKDSGRTAEVEIWWQSPMRWKREIRSPEFHQVEIVDGSHDWQKTEGDFFPEWLREIAVELIRPVPALDQVLEQAKTADAKRMMGQIDIEGITPTGTAEIRNIRRSGVALSAETGELLYAYGFGWGGEFKDYQNFHGRKIARSINWGSPEVTAKVTTLEDLAAVSSEFFDTTAKGGDTQPLRTELIDEVSLRKNLLPAEPVAWPPLQDGLLEGNVTAEIVVDREGKVREFGPIISENSAVIDAGRQRIQAMLFKPFLENGVPVQVVSQITIPFRTVRPAGTEAFDSARTYFERGWKASFLAAAATSKPYSLRAEFDAKGTEEKVDKGHYEDTWLSENQWRREASFGASRNVRSRNGGKRYELAEGPDSNVLRFILQTLEPFPATSGFVESDWRIKRDMVDGVRAVRVLAGYESPEGKLDPEQARGYWFDDSGVLLKTYLMGVETDRSDFQDFDGIRVARQIDVRKDGRLAIRIRVTDLAPAGSVPADSFELKGHERQDFAAQER